MTLQDIFYIVSIVYMSLLIVCLVIIIVLLLYIKKRIIDVADKVENFASTTTNIVTHPAETAMGIVGATISRIAQFLKNRRK